MRMRVALSCSLVCVLLSLFLPFILASYNGLGLTPAMGWNSWNHFNCHIDETIIRESADYLVSSGLRDAGYIYLNMDDCWQAPNRTASGEIYPDPAKFPSGLATLADYVHSKGLKFGIYSDAGPVTCEGRPGSRGYETQDAQSYASWGVDYLKYDNCHAPASDWVIDRYSAMSNALLATGRPIYFSMCDWGVRDPWIWGPALSNSWRTDNDIFDTYDSMLRCLDNVIGLSRYAGPGGWNDPDMLEVGNGGMTNQEYQAHFALWALLKSPLLIGADIRNMSDETKSILMAKEVIALNQDPLGVAGDLIVKRGPHEIWAGPLADGSRGVVMFNRHTFHNNQYPQHNMTVNFVNLGYASTTIAIVRDLYVERDVGEFTGSFTALVTAHSVLALRITPIFAQDADIEWRPWYTSGFGCEFKQQLSHTKLKGETNACHDNC